MSVDILRSRLEKGDLLRSPLSEDTQGILDALVSNQMFASLESSELQTIARFFMAYEVPKGGIVVREGEPGEFLCILCRGKLAVYKHASDEKIDKKITVMRQGKSFAEMALIDGLPYSATVVAEEHSTILVLTRDKLEKITNEHPKIGVTFVWQLAKLISQRLRQTTGVLLDRL